MAQACSGRLPPSGLPGARVGPEAGWPAPRQPPRPSGAESPVVGAGRPGLGHRPADTLHVHPSGCAEAQEAVGPSVRGRFAGRPGGGLRVRSEALPPPRGLQPVLLRVFSAVKWRRCPAFLPHGIHDPKEQGNTGISARTGRRDRPGPPMCPFQGMLAPRPGAPDKVRSSQASLPSEPEPRTGLFLPLGTPQVVSSP